jgi:hypothetical protein
MAYAIAAVLAGSATDPCCCEPPAECCLYSSIGYLDSSYPRTDLPSQFLFRFIFEGDTYEVTMVLQAAGDTIYIGTHDIYGDFTIKESEFSGDNWAIVNLSFGQWTSGCLISSGWENDSLPDPGETEDEFPDTLTFDWGAATTTVSRVSLCRWEGTIESEGNTYSVFVEYPGDYNWHADISDEGGNIFNGIKDGDQNTPIGDYDGGTVVVS